MKGKIGYLIALISMMGMSACGKTEPDAIVTEPDAIVTEPDVIITEPEQAVPDYTERRQQVLPDELPMETTTEEWSEKGETVFYVYRLPEKEDFLKMWVEDEQQTNLQSQAVRYLQADDGSVTLHYEAQIEAGYGEYCLGWCLVFLYEITEEGYKLQSVTLEEFPY